MEKYKQYYFWENVLKNNEEVWKNSFRNMPLSRSSRFINTVVVDCNKGVVEDNWAYYPNIEALLGFVHHVFLPTVFALILFAESEEFVTPMADVKELLEHTEEVSDDVMRELIPIMRKQNEELENIWNLDEEEMWRELINFSQEFYEIWGKGLDVFFYFNIFKTPMEVGDYLIEEYEKDKMLDYFEDESGMSREEWVSTCTGVYESDFLRKKFIDVLNNRAKDIL